MLAGDALRGHGFERDFLFEQVDDASPVGFYARADGLFIQRGHGFSLYIHHRVCDVVMCRRRAPFGYCDRAVPIGLNSANPGGLSGRERLVVTVTCKHDMEPVQEDHRRAAGRAG